MQLAGQLNHLLNRCCPRSIRVVVNELLWLKGILVAARFNWQAPETACNRLEVDRGGCYRALEVGARIEEERRQIGILTRKTSNLISFNLGCKISSDNISCSLFNDSGCFAPYQNVFFLPAIKEPDDEVIDADQPKKVRQCVNLLGGEEEAADQNLWLMRSQYLQINVDIAPGR